MKRMSHDFVVARSCSMLLAVLLPRCCGGGSSSTPPPGGLSYPSPQVFEIGHAISTLTPTVTGTVTSYAVNPALPAGLNLNANTGTITGTPTAVASAANYTITASNAGGSSTASISITVNDVAPSISYGSTDLTFTTGVPVHPLTPNSSGGAVVTWSISPALPPGLTFSMTDGSIGGTPTAVAASASYVVTADNSGGRSTASLTIAVESSVLLELGHAYQIQFLRLNSTRALSQDDAGHWVLWDVAAASILASGDSPCRFMPPDECRPRDDFLPVELAAQTVVVETVDGLEVRASADGAVLSTIAGAFSWWKVASDGSYICAGTSSGLSVWSRLGQTLITRPGDYSTARVFAAAGEVRVALGPAGQNVVETISLATGTSSVSPPFQGQFHSWFLDGERFLTNVLTTVWTYSRNGVQQDLASLPTSQNLVGQGGWFWTFQRGSLSLYAVGASASPTATYEGVNNAVPSGMTIGAFFGDSEVGVIDLSGPTPSIADHVLPIAYTSAYGASSSSKWLVGNRHGVVLDGASLSGAPRCFGVGAAWSIAGSAERIAVATALGRILFFNARTKVLEGSIESFSSKLALSSDGSILAAENFSDTSIKIFSLPSATETYRWSYASELVNFSLSGSGTALGQTLAVSPGSTRQVTAPTGGPLVWSEPSPLPLSAPLRLSTDGTLIAASIIDPIVEITQEMGTSIFLNGRFVTAVSGLAAGWIDNGRLLVNNYVRDIHGTAGMDTREPRSTILRASNSRPLCSPRSS